MTADPMQIPTIIHMLMLCIAEESDSDVVRVAATDEDERAHGELPRQQSTGHESCHEKNQMNPQHCIA